MCSGCYEEYGKPAVVSDKTREAAKLIARVYDYSCVGGALHIVIDDWNLEDDHLDFCEGEIDRIPEAGAMGAAQRACLNALRALSIDERASALAIHDGYLAAN